MKICLVTTDSSASRYIGSALLESNYCHMILVDTFGDRKRKPQSILKKIRKHYKRGGLRDLFILVKSCLGLGKKVAGNSSGQMDIAPSWDELKERHNAPIHFVENINSDSSMTLIESGAYDLGVIYGGRIIKQAVLDMPRLGFINKHSSLLPKQRGPQAEFWALYKEELSTVGVTIHEVTPELDAGAILLQESMSFEVGDTPDSLREKSHVIGAGLLVEAIRQIESGELKKVVQDEASATTNGMPSLSQVSELNSKLPDLWARCEKTNNQ